MDLGRYIKAAQSIAPAAHGTTVGTEGSAVDAAGFREALMILDIGAVGANGAVLVKVQESADGLTGWADIVGASVSLGPTAANSIRGGRIVMTATRQRHLRAYMIVGVAASAFSASFLLADAAQLPAATPAFDVCT